ncbi:MAG TPA: hypothetical protein VHK64_09885 [Nocardioidaceae bacterium]|nr:hypothetical protein [Nocardioidaceae bacterium]
MPQRSQGLRSPAFTRVACSRTDSAAISQLAALSVRLHATLVKAGLRT